VALDETVDISYGIFTGCLQTLEWTPLEPGVSEHKYYAPGIGMVLEAKVGGTERVELVDRVPPPSHLSPSDFTADLDHPFLPLAAGTVFTYEGLSDGEEERVVVEVTEETRTVQGIACRVVRDRVWIDDELVEDTFDWFAQHRNGDLWYFGEDVKDYEDGVLVSTAGSWEAGKDGARPGILLPAQPILGEAYRQELLVGEAEDMARVVGLAASAEVVYGSFSGCWETEESTPLEPEVLELKVYAPGVGMVLSRDLRGGDDQLELVDVQRVP
jgi:hypothetical protein